MQHLNKDDKEFFKKCRKLVRHSQEMELTTGYKKNKFNYAAFVMQLQKIVRKLGIENEIYDKL